jgi:hypothetical protein
VHLLAVSVTVEAALILILSLISIRSFGLIGVAFSSAIGSLTVRLVVIPLALQKTLGLRVAHVVRHACGRPVIVGALLVPQFIGIRLLVPSGDFLHLLIHGVLAGASVTSTVLLAGVTSEERTRFLVNPVRRFFKAENIAGETTGK